MPIANPRAIREKFGDDYLANERTYVMGIDQRLSAAVAKRFRGRTVLETCTGAGFTTIALARVADQVVTVEVEPLHQQQARVNTSRAGVEHRVAFVSGEILSLLVSDRLPPFDSAFLDPDWAVTGPDHVYRFTNSNTRPPADRLLRAVMIRTQDVALVLPPRVDTCEFQGLPSHECQCLFLGESHELYCLYFGQLARGTSRTTLRL